jgi:two-component system invasion response regulator UvrY
MIRVMLVDDSDAFRGTAANFLGTLDGVEVVGAAASGLEAIEQVGRLKPDLVLVDAIMPWMSGFDVTRRIKELQPALRVVMVSLHDSAAYREAAQMAGADGFLGKDQFAPALPALLREMFG